MFRRELTLVKAIAVPQVPRSVYFPRKFNTFLPKLCICRRRERKRLESSFSLFTESGKRSAASRIFIAPASTYTYVCISIDEFSNTPICLILCDRFSVDGTKIAENGLEVVFALTGSFVRFYEYTHSCYTRTWLRYDVCNDKIIPTRSL